MLTLFLTLFGRLWYLQVFSGDDYQAKAADQSVRDIVVQPARGLIVDDMGRPLVANRTSWVVTVDRTMLQQDAADGLQKRLLQRIAGSVGSSYADDQRAHAAVRRAEARRPACAGTGRPTSRSRSPRTSRSRPR